MKFPKENIIDNWLEKNHDPEIQRLVERNLEIANNVIDVLKEKNISKSELAKRMNKQPSEVSKWLSGTHNLNMKSIVKLEIALGVDLLNLRRIKTKDLDLIDDTNFIYLDQDKFVLEDYDQTFSTKEKVEHELNDNWKNIFENIFKESEQLCFSNTLIETTANRKSKKDCKVIPMPAA
jgi:transcriptional regulator with XRE-family HTH domain